MSEIVPMPMLEGAKYVSLRLGTAGRHRVHGPLCCGASEGLEEAVCNEVIPIGCHSTRYGRQCVEGKACEIYWSTAKPFREECMVEGADAQSCHKQPSCKETSIVNTRVRIVEVMGNSLVRVTPDRPNPNVGPMKGKLGIMMLEANGAENEHSATITTMTIFWRGV